MMRSPPVDDTSAKGPRRVVRRARAGNWLSQLFDSPSPANSQVINRTDAILNCLIAAIALASALPFFYAANGQLPEAGDMVIHWPRMLAFDESLRSGVYLPRWLGGMNGGYGAATTLFYAPLLYYALSAAHAITGDWPMSLEIVVALAAVGSGVAMYATARALWSRVASAIAALFYVLSPYHLIDLYHRGAFAELLAFVWMPLVVWAFIRLTRGFSPAALAGGALAMALLVLTHPPTAYLFSIAYVALVLFYAVHARQWAPLFNGLVVLCIGAVLAAFYALPALLEKSLVNQSVTDLFHQRGGFINELLTGNRFERLIGAIAMTLAWLSVALIWMAGRQRHNGSEESFATRWRHLAAWKVVTVLSFVLLLPITKPLLKAMPGMAAVAFVWRWLAVATLAVAMLAGAATEGWQQTFRRLRRRANKDSDLYLAKAVIVALLLIATAAFGVIAAAQASNLRIAFVAPAENFEQDFTPAGTPSVYELPRGKDCEFIHALPGDSARLVDWRPERRAIETTTTTGGLLHVYTLMYPGWTATVDGSPAAINPHSSLKTMLIAMPPGNCRLVLLFTETSSRRISRWVSQTALIALAVMLIGSWFRHRRPLRMRTARR